MTMKKWSLVTDSNCGTLNTGWYGIGSPFSASMPNTAESPENRIVISKVTMMNDGHEFSGRPPMFTG